VRAALSVTFAAALVVAGCSGSPEPDALGTSETSPASTPSPPPTTTTSTTAPTTTTSSTPTPIPRGTAKITPLRSLPPREKLPAFRAVRIAGANYPAGLAAAPDGRIFYSELWGGKIRVIRPDGSVDPKPWADVNALYGIKWEQFYHGGLSGIAFDPAFERNHFVYVVTQVPDKKTGFATKSRIVRFKEKKGRGTSPRILLEISASKFDNTYSLVFGPDEMLYIPSGFLGTNRPGNLRGKILRVTRDGKPPGDNPYGADAPRVWATGFKNAFDLAFFPGKDLAVAGENGTDAHDEINLLLPGHDYGYPKHEGFTRNPKVTPPMLDYKDDRQAPVGIIYYRGRRYPALRGRFLMCENSGNGMVALRIDRSDPGKLLNMTPIVSECTLDIVQAADGTVVFSDAEAIYRLAPG
jgi:glucose/arabinose dehydrogenase